MYIVKQKENQDEKQFMYHANILCYKKTKKDTCIYVHFLWKNI